MCVKRRKIIICFYICAPFQASVRSIPFGRRVEPARLAAAPITMAGMPSDMGTLASVLAAQHGLAAKDGGTARRPRRSAYRRCRGPVADELGRCAQGVHTPACVLFGHGAHHQRQLRHIDDGHLQLVRRSARSSRP